MPVRATKRGAARVPFPTGADADVLICGASFAGLTVARELRATGARVLVLDRYEIGERQTSACAAPTEWLRNLGLEASIRQTFDSLLVHTPGVERARWPLPLTFSTFDYRELCDAVVGAGAATPSSRPRRSSRTHRQRRCSTDRGDVRAPLIVDALGWRRVLGPGDNVQPPGRRRCRGASRCIRAASATTWSCGSTRATSTRATAGRFRRATSCGSASAPSTRTIRSSSRRCGWSRTSTQQPHGYQGNWIPHRIRPGDRGRRVLRRRQRRPLPAADRRGHPDGVLLRDRARARAARGARAAARTRPPPWSATARSPPRTAGSSRRCTRAQQSIRHLHGRPLDALARVFTRPRVSRLGVPALPRDRAAAVRGPRAARRCCRRRGASRERAAA